MDSAAKARVAAAAAKKGTSMTEFMIAAALAEAGRVESHSPPPPTTTFQGVPTFFRACCEEARQGGARGYDHAGWHLGLHTAELCEWDTDEERDAKLDTLRDLLDQEDDEGVLAWYELEFPRCMQLVPR
ncbi:MAG: hypothetical protein ACYSUQ_03255 [Planctomycetota bacterium]